MAAAHSSQTQWMPSMVERLDPMFIVLDGKASLTLRTYEDVRRFLVPSGQERTRGLQGQVWRAATEEEKRSAIATFEKWADYTGLLLGTEPNPESGSTKSSIGAEPPQGV